MPTSIVCPKCKTWNTDLAHCKNCNELLDFEQKRAQAELKRIAEENNKEPDAYDRFHTAFKHNRFWLIRAVYYILYSIWFLLFSITSFLIAGTAAGPG